ncbi:MAG: hypothetical protein JXM73_25345 [Anaerolineae bacterium]|nr:hypothetical protein [Anaerolineae bacterium]
MIDTKALHIDRQPAPAPAKTEGNLQEYMKQQADTLDAAVQSFGLPLAVTRGLFVGTTRRPSHFIYVLAPQPMATAPRLGKIDRAAFTEALQEAAGSGVTWETEHDSIEIKVPMPRELQDLLLQMARQQG